MGGEIIYSVGQKELLWVARVEFQRNFRKWYCGCLWSNSVAGITMVPDSATMQALMTNTLCDLRQIKPQ